MSVMRDEFECTWKLSCVDYYESLVERHDDHFLC